MAYLNLANAAFDMRSLDLNGVFQGASNTANSSYGDQGSWSPGPAFGFMTFSTQLNSVMRLENSALTFDVATANDFQLLGSGLDPAFFSGTIRYLEGSFNTGQGAIQLWADIDANVFGQTVATAFGNDDRMLVRNALAGDDFVVGSSADDYVELWSGSDFYWDYGGTDRVLGGLGNDLISAGSDSNNDTIRGDAGNDILYLQGGHGLMQGGPGRDVLISGGGSSISRGGFGVDSFVFSATSGRYVIRDFDPLQEKIYLALSQSDFDALIWRTGSNGLRIGSDTFSILLLGVDPAQVDASDFILDAGTYGEQQMQTFLAGFSVD